MANRESRSVAAISRALANGIDQELPLIHLLVRLSHTAFGASHLSARLPAAFGSGSVSQHSFHPETLRPGPVRSGRHAASDDYASLGIWLSRPGTKACSCALPGLRLPAQPPLHPRQRMAIKFNRMGHR